MNLKSLSKNYDCLTPEERFRLILAANGRGDEAESDRLVRAGKRVTHSVQDHAPYARAFMELDSLTFIEAVEDASRYFDAYQRVVGALGLNVDDLIGSPAESGRAENAPVSPECVRAVEAKISACASAWHRYHDQARALGYVLRTKMDGWQQFCEGMNVPPFFSWTVFPGYDRLQSRLEHAREYGFSQEEFRAWLNAIRPDGEPELKKVALNAAAIAAANREAFRERVRWWGGEPDAASQ